MTFSFSRRYKKRILRRILKRRLKKKELDMQKFLKRKILRINMIHYSRAIRHLKGLSNINTMRHNYRIREICKGNKSKLKTSYSVPMKVKRRLVNLKNLSFFLNKYKNNKKKIKERRLKMRLYIKRRKLNMKKRNLINNIWKKELFNWASRSKFRSRNKIDAYLRFMQNQIQKSTRSFAIFSLPIHSFLSRVMFKTLESALFLTAFENSIAPEELKHPKEQFISQKRAFLEFARILRYRFNLKKEFKSAMFWSSRNNFLLNVHNRYKYFDNIKSILKRKIKRASFVEGFNPDIFKVALGVKYIKHRRRRIKFFLKEGKVLILRKGKVFLFKKKRGKYILFKKKKQKKRYKAKSLFTFLKKLNSEKFTNKVLKKIIWHYYSRSIKNHYQSSIFNNPVIFDNKYSLKWGKVNSFFYKQARNFRAHNLHKYNYIYFNISIFRYLQLKSYINKIVKVFNIIIKKKFEPLYGLALSSFKKNLFFLVKQFTKINIHLQQYNDLYEDFSYRKADQVYDDKRMIFVASRLKLKHIKDFYLSFLKQTFIKYFKLNLHFKFEKKNIFITVTNHKGDVKFRHSIGMLGYKKDKKKTYYASKELIRHAIPKLFGIFKIRDSVVSQALRLSSTHLFNFYLKYLERKDINKEYWNYPSKLKKSLRLGLYKILLGTMKKYVTLRIILKGSKARLRGLMRKVFKSLRSFKKENKKLVPRILFLALNTKPHNGCRSPKKGRRRTKRRRQRLRVRLINKKFEYEQKFLRRSFFKRRYRLGVKKKGKRLPKVFSNNLLDKDYKKSLRHLKKQNKLSNLQGNFFPMKKYHFLYGGPRRKGPKHFEKYKKKYTRRERVWKDFERWINPIAIKPRNFTFKKSSYKRKPIFYNLYN